MFRARYHGGMNSANRLGFRKSFVFWSPLAMTWFMMALEGPILAAIVARLAEPKANLAAHGVAFAIAIIIEAPVIMMMSASTALAGDRDSFVWGRTVRATSSGSRVPVPLPSSRWSARIRGEAPVLAAAAPSWPARPVIFPPRPSPTHPFRQQLTPYWVLGTDHSLRPIARYRTHPGPRGQVLFFVLCPDALLWRGAVLPCVRPRNCVPTVRRKPEDTKKNKKQDLTPIQIQASAHNTQSPPTAFGGSTALTLTLSQAHPGPMASRLVFCSLSLHGVRSCFLFFAPTGSCDAARSLLLRPEMKGTLGGQSAG